jgi:hypothetical protein
VITEGTATSFRMRFLVTSATTLFCVVNLLICCRLSPAVALHLIGYLSRSDILCGLDDLECWTIRHRHAACCFIFASKTSLHSITYWSCYFFRRFTTVLETQHQGDVEALKREHLEKGPQEEKDKFRGYLTHSYSLMSV